MVQGELVQANEITVLAGKYPIVCRLMLVLDKEQLTKDGKLRETILRYVLSRDGQNVVMKSGFFPLDPGFFHPDSGKNRPVNRSGFEMTERVARLSTVKVTSFRKSGETMKRVTIGGVVGSVVIGAIGLYILAGRSPAELRGYVRASASKTIDDIKDQIPNEIHDRKLDNDLAQVRQEVIDRQVQLNLSKSSVASLKEQVLQLEGRTSRRERILAEAFPILESATNDNKAKVSFAGQEFAIDEFKKEIDNLLTEQDRESRQLEIKKNGLERIERGAREGEQAIAEMKSSLDNTEQEVLVIRSRRAQAEVESKTLDMVASVTEGSSSATSTVGGSLAHLKGGVEKLEARNDARRSNAPVTHRPSNQLTKGFSRLESLKAIHDKLNADKDQDK